MLNTGLVCSGKRDSFSPACLAPSCNNNCSSLGHVSCEIKDDRLMIDLTCEM